MQYTQHEEDRRLLKYRWEAALHDRVAFLYRTDDHYHYLLAQADEGYQLGLICLSERQEMVTRALCAYSWNVEHNITRETHWCLGCYYHVLVVAESSDAEGASRADCSSAGRSGRGFRMVQGQHRRR